MQRAELELPRSLLRELWRPESLECLARAYWRHLSRISLGLIRVVHEPDARVVVLVSRRLALLRFHAPEYETDDKHGVVTWRIDRGLLVSRRGRGRGFLRIEVRRGGEAASAAGGEVRETLRLEVSVANFYPWLRGSGWFSRFGTWIYSQTQLRLHVLICNGFLRSLAELGSQKR